MHHSLTIVVITLFSVCYTSQASSENNTSEVRSMRANVSAGQQVSPEESRKIRAQKNFNLIDTNGNGALSRMEFADRPLPDQGYWYKKVDVLNAQIMRLDRNMDGFLQASEYGKLMVEGSVYGTLPNFSEISSNDRIDYCQLTTSIATHHARINFAVRDTNNDNTISFEEYVTYKK